MLIAGPGVYICNECVGLANEILVQDLPSWHWRSKSSSSTGAENDANEPPGARLMGAEDEDEDDGVAVASPPEKDEKLDRLWHSFKALERGNARARLIEHYIPLVRQAVDTIERRDLINLGMSELIDSLKTFEPGPGKSFEAFARPRIREAILDELRAIAQSNTPSSD